MNSSALFRAIYDFSVTLFSSIVLFHSIFSPMQTHYLLVLVCRAVYF